MSNQGMIDALLEERRGYATRGLKDRVAAVDEQLAHYGHEPPKESSELSAAEQRAASQSEGEAPKRRGRPPKATTEQQAPKDES